MPDEYDFARRQMAKDALRGRGIYMGGKKQNIPAPQKGIVSEEKPEARENTPYTPDAKKASGIYSDEKQEARENTPYTPDVKKTPGIYSDEKQENPQQRESQGIHSDDKNAVNKAHNEAILKQWADSRAGNKIVTYPEDTKFEGPQINTSKGIHSEGYVPAQAKAPGIYSHEVPDSDADQKSFDTRRHLLDHAARNIGERVGSHDRPDLLGDSVRFTPDRARVGLTDAREQHQQNQNKTTVRALLPGGFTPSTAGALFNFGGYLDGTNPTQTQWIGFILGTGDTEIGSMTISNAVFASPPAVGDVLIGDNIASPNVTSVTLAGNGTYTIEIDAPAFGTETKGPLRATGQTHPYLGTNAQGPPVNGVWQFNLNLFPYYFATASFILATGGSFSGSMKIEILDAMGGTLSTSMLDVSGSDDGTAPLLSISSGISSQGVETFASFNGIKFSVNGGNIINPFQDQVTLNLFVLDPDIQVLG